MRSLGGGPPQPEGEEWLREGEGGNKTKEAREEVRLALRFRPPGNVPRPWERGPDERRRSWGKTGRENRRAIVRGPARRCTRSSLPALPLCALMSLRARWGPMFGVL